MPLVPPSIDDRYRGSVAAARFLALLGVLTVVPGCLHVFLPDGGAGVIAGIGMEACGPIVIALFAWAGPRRSRSGHSWSWWRSVTDHWYRRRWRSCCSSGRCTRSTGGS